MPRPTVSDITEEVYAALEPLSRFDEQLGWPLLLYIEAWAGSMLGDLYDIVRDRDEQAGWAVLFDPDQCPADGLQYLAQFVGVQLSDSMTESEKRAAIKNPEGFARGTPAAMSEAIKRTLTGNKSVMITERHLNSAWNLWVRTLASETPSQEETEVAILSQKPIGIVLLYETVTGQAWADVVGENADWAAVLSAYSSWDDLVTTEPAP